MFVHMLDLLSDRKAAQQLDFEVTVFRRRYTRYDADDLSFMHGENMLPGKIHVLSPGMAIASIHFHVYSCIV